MNCPKCHGKLVNIRAVLNQEYVHGDYSGKRITLSVDQCFSCNGTWFDVGELKNYLNEGLTIINSPGIDSVLQTKYEDKVGHCPKCNIRMDKHPAPKLKTFLVDKCGKCEGIWLDSTEIDSLEDANEEANHKLFGIINNLF